MRLRIHALLSISSRVCGAIVISIVGIMVWVVRQMGPKKSVPRSSFASYPSMLSLVDSQANWKFPIYHSERVSKNSVFIAHATTLPSPELLPALLQELGAHPCLKRASHGMHAYRTFPNNFPEFPHMLLGQNDGVSIKTAGSTGMQKCHCCRVQMARWCKLRVRGMEADVGCRKGGFENGSFRQET